MAKLGIRIELITPSTRFALVARGHVFRYNQCVYVKADSANADHNAFNLSTASFVKISETEEVYMVDEAIITIK